MATVTPADQEPSLREAAARIGLLMGAAVDPAHFSEAEYAETLTRELNMVEPENAMKWRHTEPARGQFTFEAGDQVVTFAEAHQMKVRGHNLLWATHNPAWLAQGRFTPPELREIMHEHIERVAGHYAGKVFAWDVVNEAFDKQGGLSHSIWYDRPGIGLASEGTAYIEQAFRWAHEADPTALLFYNDYAAEGLNAKSDAIYAMVKDFKRRGVPIDGIGLQMHLSLDDAARMGSLDANINRLAALGVQVHITEMDVGLAVASGEQASAQLPNAASNAASKSGPNEAMTSADFRQQADLYSRVAGICARNPGCTAFQTWGFTDRYSWIPAFSHGKRGAALLFDADYKPKLCYDAVLKAFEAVTHPPVRLGR
ncbi:MAG TPA: endo-1,4-beta-xylanase [Terriglobia bacterium]|nr:endo-1,4-beta-xylanase [Terriglobia bacterium]